MPSTLSQFALKSYINQSANHCNHSVSVYELSSEEINFSTMKSIFGVLALVLALIAVAFGAPEPSFNRPGGRGGHLGGGPLINRPPPPRQPKYNF